MSHDTINEDAKIAELERGIPPIVARDRRDKSCRDPVARLRHFSASSLSVSQGCAGDWPYRTPCRATSACFPFL